MNIYLVVGKTGVGMDSRTWIESARVSKKFAEGRVDVLNRILEHFNALGLDNDIDSEEVEEIEIAFRVANDKNFKLDYTGAVYCVVETQLVND